jgi:small subunit ribosomal protein S27e
VRRLRQGTPETVHPGPQIRNQEVSTVAAHFLKVKCKDCDNEQIVFSRASTEVRCNICGTTLAEPTGGMARIKGDIIGELPHA